MPGDYVYYGITGAVGKSIGGFSTAEEKNVDVKTLTNPHAESITKRPMIP